MTEVAPPVGVWIETGYSEHPGRIILVAPPVGVWIETNIPIKRLFCASKSRPPWACGLKLDSLPSFQ